MSRPSISEYYRPRSLEEAWDLIAGGGSTARVLSGGADLTISAPPEVTVIVDIARAVSRDIQISADGSVAIGAMATLTSMLEHQGLAGRAGGVMREMLVHVGNPLLRNSSTIGGHVARGKLSDIVPVLIALDAEITVYQGFEETIPLQDYYDEGRHQDPHIVTGLHLPPLPDRSTAAYLRFARTAFDFPILNSCCRVDPGDDGVAAVRIVCGATPLLAQRATEAEALIAERGLSTAAIDSAAAAAREEIITRSGWVASAEYRSHLVGVLTRRCLTLVADRLERA